MSTKTAMEHTRKKVVEVVKPSPSLAREHRAELPRHTDILTRPSVRLLHYGAEEPSFGHDFSRIAVHSEAEGTHQVPQSCPLKLNSPRFCPFGGACHTCSTRVQTKLAVNKPGDEYEQEADRVAEQVMRMSEIRTPERAAVSGQADSLRIQRMCLECEEEETLRAKAVLGQTPRASPDLEAHLNAIRGGGQPLLGSARYFFEPRFGYDFSRVRIHADALAVESARALNARAYTVGQDVVFGAGQYAPETIVGKRLLAHELTHVAQQTDSLLGCNPRYSWHVEHPDNREMRQGGIANQPTPRQAISGLPVSLRRLHTETPGLTIRRQPFRDCTPAITGIPDANARIDTARRVAVTMVTHALGRLRFALAAATNPLLTVPPDVTATLNIHFHGPNAAQLRHIIATFEHIQRTLPNDRAYICNTSGSYYCSRRDWDAYADCPGGIIHLCPSVFVHPWLPLPQALIHEAAHRAGACGDCYHYNPCYGTQPAAGAQNNADSYALFAHAVMPRPTLGPPAPERPRFPSLIESIIEKGPGVRERVIRSVEEL